LRRVACTPRVPFIVEMRSIRGCGSDPGCARVETVLRTKKVTLNHPKR
jgi:hypothetical protein